MLDRALGQVQLHHVAARVHGNAAGTIEQSLGRGAIAVASLEQPGDLPRVTDRLELLQDEWGYLLLWATLAIACAAALSLVAIPLIFGWRTIFSRNPGKLRTIVYFACLGAGYIMVEVGLISEFMLALSNATVSASVLITGMLVHSQAEATAKTVSKTLNRSSHEADWPTRLTRW